VTYRIALERLRAYAPKALSRGAFYEPSTGSCCAAGAVAPCLREYGDAVTEERCMSLWQSAQRELNIRPQELNALTGTNDVGGPDDETPAARYVRVLAWLEAAVAAEAP
jgi:hypothetical protein